MKRVLLIRHGESQHNASGDCLSGIADIPITTAGHDQALALKLELDRYAVGAVYASPLSRAVETGRLSVPSFLDSIKITQCLMEFDYGDYDGIPSSQLDATDPVIRKWNHSPGNLSFPNGGCIAEHAESAYRGLVDLVSSEPANTIVCFSHKTTIRLLIAKMLGLSLDYFRRIPCRNASISECKYHDNIFSLETINCICGDARTDEGWQ